MNADVRVRLGEARVLGRVEKGARVAVRVANWPASGSVLRITSTLGVGQVISHGTRRTSPRTTTGPAAALRRTTNSFSSLRTSSRSDHYDQARMGHKHTKEEILAGALATAFDVGLSQLTYGRVAKRLGINDRVVVYYFPTKDVLAGDVLVAMGAQLQETLAPAFASPRADHLALLRAAWPLLADPDADAVFALFFEANGLAAAGREPFRSLVPQLVEAWIVWAATFIDGTPKERRTEAETAVAVIDGLLLLRQLAGPAAANRAARRLGIR